MAEPFLDEQQWQQLGDEERVLREVSIRGSGCSGRGRIAVERAAGAAENAPVRERWRAVARETVEIVARGSYVNGAGVGVPLGEQVGAAVAGTQLYLPEDELAEPAAGGGAPVVEVTNETSLSAARRLGEDVACLVFASARNPGGGFLNGAQAQEESIARASALYACQTAEPEFYAYHRSHSDLRYSDRVIYSPRVPVFRDDSGALLAQPYPVSFLTAAAPNLGAIRANQPERAESVPAALRSRAARVLAVAAAHRHRALVLGAWGCGVFGNDPALVAQTFAMLLPGAWGFDRVVFAVYDAAPATPTYAAFARVFG